jgi:myo-inositol-1(or 4)-monophosphatase
MKTFDEKRALVAAVDAARAAGRLMRQNLRETKSVNDQSRYDIKLALDVQCQKLIENKLHARFPHVGFLGEEGDGYNGEEEYRWVVDPIDGTVNFAYGIPHACVSIALQSRIATKHLSRRKRKSALEEALSYEDYSTIIGVVYDPFTNELWTAVLGQRSLLNGVPIQVSHRKRLADSIIMLGFGKSRENVAWGCRYFTWLVRQVRKIRMLGSAALALTYVATGRMDGFIEHDVRIWDIAAGGFIIERAGGEFWRKQIDNRHGYRLIATNGLLRQTLRVPK